MAVLHGLIAGKTMNESKGYRTTTLLALRMMIH